ncbi:hypothetical protein GJ496_009910 [Pomphorhynchus laevis]|nr:hypothetical protein GJ496_009910 [Pomphorhynchus laevis]
MTVNVPIANTLAIKAFSNLRTNKSDNLEVGGKGSGRIQTRKIRAKHFGEGTYSFKRSSSCPVVANPKHITRSNYFKHRNMYSLITWPLSASEKRIKPTKHFDEQMRNVVLSKLCLKDIRSCRNAWGKMSYAELISLAISNSIWKHMTLGEICAWFVEYVPFFKDKSDPSKRWGWKNSIRHNLSLHDRFVRVRLINAKNDRKPNNTSTKYVWALNVNSEPTSENSMITDLARKRRRTCDNVYIKNKYFKNQQAIEDQQYDDLRNVKDKLIRRHLTNALLQSHISSEITDIHTNTRRQIRMYSALTSNNTLNTSIMDMKLSKYISCQPNQLYSLQTNTSEVYSKNKGVNGKRLSNDGIIKHILCNADTQDNKKINATFLMKHLNTIAPFIRQPSYSSFDTSKCVNHQLVDMAVQTDKFCKCTQYVQTYFNDIMNSTGICKEVAISESLASYWEFKCALDIVYKLKKLPPRKRVHFYQIIMEIDNCLSDSSRVEKPIDYSIKLGIDNM